MLKILIIELTSPINHSLLMIVSCLALSHFYPNLQKLAKRIMLVTACWFVLCSQLFFSNLLLLPLENYAKPILASDIQHHDNSAIYVLAAYHKDTPENPWVDRFNMPGVLRLTHAYLLYRNSPQPIILTGADFSTESKKTFADEAKKYLVNLGIPSKDIITISEGDTTAKEFKALSRQDLPFEHFNIVSSASHMYRVSVMLERHGITDFTLHPIHRKSVLSELTYINFPRIESLRYTQSAIYEYIAILNTKFLAQ